jgi:glycosyltransferase involved in cell wall biosynthesis
MYNETVSNAAAKVAKYFSVANTRYFSIHNAAFKSFRPEGKIRGQVLLAHEIDALLLEPGAPVPVSHNNLGEARAMLEALLEQGFAVDAISRLRTRFRPRKRYDLFIAPRANLAPIAARLNADCIKVAHLDTSHWLFNDAAVFARERELLARRGVALESHKFVSPNAAIETADYATLLGNGFDYETYAFAGKPIFQVPNPAAVLYPWFADKDFAACAGRFLWIGSAGLVHKGLDLVLEAFARMPELHLTVCGPIKADPAFEAAFRRELYQTPNIETLGWVDIASPEFADRLKRTVGLIYPSCAEACCGTVINSMQAGLIPLVSVESGIDIEPDFGVLLAANSVAAVEQAVRALAARPGPELAAMARRAWTVARASYTRERYRQVFGAAIARIAAEHPNPSFSGFMPMPGAESAPAPLQAAQGR